MKHVIVTFLLFVGLSFPVFAYELEVTEVSRPYEIFAVGSDAETERVFLGELNDFPIMYEINAEESFTLHANIKQLYHGGASPDPFSLIVVRKNNRGGGVSEVARLKPGTDSWSVVKDRVLGLTFFESNSLDIAVGPGVYRVEVSTPENIGRYMLTIGTEDDDIGYFETLINVHTTQKFFGYSLLRLLASSYVYYVIGVLLVLLAMQKTWKYRKSISYVD